MRNLALLFATCAAIAPAVAAADATTRSGATDSATAHSDAAHSSAAPVRANTLADVLFRFDSSALSDDAAALIRPAVSFAAKHPVARIVVDAHCDPIGTSPYNAGLAVRRAESVRKRLLDAGVPEAQIVMAIYGEDGPRRATYAEDRRVTLWWTREPIAAVTSHTFADRGTAVEWGQPLTTAQLEARPEPVASRLASGGIAGAVHSQR